MIEAKAGLLTPATANTPEMRQYRLRYAKADVAEGEVSDILTVSTAP